MALPFTPVRGVVSGRTLEDSCRISTDDQGDTHPNKETLFSHEPPFSPGHRSGMKKWVREENGKPTSAGIKSQSSAWSLAFCQRRMKKRIPTRRTLKAGTRAPTVMNAWEET